MASPWWASRVNTSCAGPSKIARPASTPSASCTAWARGGVIRRQFLIESIALSLVGGIIGVLFGIAASVAISKTLHWPTLVSPVSILVSVLFSVLVGVVFGYYPARKAAALDPIDALRYE